MKLWTEQNTYSDDTRDARLALLTYLKDEHGISPQTQELHDLIDATVDAAHHEAAEYVRRELRSLDLRLAHA